MISQSHVYIYECARLQNLGRALENVKRKCYYYIKGYSLIVGKCDPCFLMDSPSMESLMPALVHERAKSKIKFTPEIAKIILCFFSLDVFNSRIIKSLKT